MRKSKATSKDPLSLRLTPEMHQRLQAAADAVRKPKNTLAQEAIKAAVEAIERNNWKIVAPIEFDVTYVPVPRSGAAAPQSDTETQMIIEEKNRLEKEP